MIKKPSRRKSPEAKLKQIDRLCRKINERIAQLDAAVHVPLAESSPRVGMSTIFDLDCGPSCPMRALERKYFKRRMRLRKPQQEALAEIARSRLKQNPRIATIVRQENVAERRLWLKDQANKLQRNGLDIAGSRKDRRQLRALYHAKFGKSDGTFRKDLKSVGYQTR